MNVISYEHKILYTQFHVVFLKEFLSLGCVGFRSCVHLEVAMWENAM